MAKKKRKKSRLICILEFISVSLLFRVSGLLPFMALNAVSGFLGNLLYLLAARRREIAVDNLRKAFKGEKSDGEIKRIARQSCQSFFLTFLEVMKSRSLLTGPDVINSLRRSTEGLDELFLKARKIHDDAGGCIFVTPHIGNWEVLPAISAVVGITLAVVVRPLDNPYLERLIYAHRADSGQLIIPKRNAFFVLRRTLQQGKSIGMLPDQSTMKGVSVDYFGRKATTTPVPAILAITYKRPIVVVACCRKAGGQAYEGFVSDPIYPGSFESEKAEIFRLTGEMNRSMETIIRKYPEQYLWIHNRWKTYKDKSDLISEE